MLAIRHRNDKKLPADLNMTCDIFDGYLTIFDDIGMIFDDV
jgi:hypothetical protein